MTLTVSAIITSAFSVIFLLIVLSYYALLFSKRTRGTPRPFKSLTIIIPAHNEAKRIKDTIDAAKRARFPGRKELIVIDDGSTDNTAKIARACGVRVIRQKHSGKSFAINAGIRATRSELVAIIDADSMIAPDALRECIAGFTDDRVAAVSAVVRVRNRDSILGMWLHIEQLYGSLLRSLYAKLNANIVATGPLTVFRRDALAAIGNFNTKGFSEDIDIAVRLIRADYKVAFAEKAFSETIMPTSARGFWLQRSRFSRGLVQIFKRHVRLERGLVRLYTLPLFFFSYVQAVVMSVLLLIQIGSGYWHYFAVKGEWISWLVVRYILEWFSVLGIINWAIRLFSGAEPWTFFAAIGLAASLLTYPLYVLAVVRYDKVRLPQLLAIMFLFPFWLIVMVVYTIHIGEWFSPETKNRWVKE